MNVTLERKYGTITLPKDVFEFIESRGMYIACNRFKSTRGYYFQVMVCQKTGSRTVYRQQLSRLILKAPSGLHVDHIDRNALNNSRENLRLCTQAENSRNRSKSACTKFPYKGVTQRKSGNFYSVLRSTENNKKLRYSIGPFGSEEGAARGYDKLAKWLFGEFAALNFPEKK